MPTRLRPFVVAGVLAFAELASAAPPAAEGGKFYCCTDASGKYVCGDILPQTCYGRAYRELGADGRTIREIAAPLTAEQRAQRASEEDQRRKDAISQKEQERKDLVLLETYVDLADLEVMRKRALDGVSQLIRNAEERIAEIQAQRKKYEDEAEFYHNKALPPEIEKGLADAESEIKAQETVIEAKKKDLTMLQEKFDEDRKRFLDLQQRKASK
jgi:hypothetical protein